MAKTLQEILADPKNYADELTIQIGDTPVPLGSLRSIGKSEQDRLTSELSKATEARTQAEKERENALSLSQKAAELNAALEARIAADPRGTPTQDQFETDPWYEPIRKRLSKYDEAVTKFNDAVSKLENMQKNQAIVYADRLWDSEYEGLKFTDKNRKTRDEILKFAAENKIVDKHGIPSVRLAWDKMTEVDRMAEAAEAARLEGIEQGKREAFVSRVRPPSTVPPSGNGAVQFDDWNKLTDAALADPEIRKLVERTGFGIQ